MDISRYCWILGLVLILRQIHACAHARIARSATRPEVCSLTIPFFERIHVEMCTVEHMIEKKVSSLGFEFEFKMTAFKLYLSSGNAGSTIISYGALPSV